MRGSSPNRTVNGGEVERELSSGRAREHGDGEDEEREPGPTSTDEHQDNHANESGGDRRDDAVEHWDEAAVGKDRREQDWTDGEDRKEVESSPSSDVANC